MLVLEHDRSLGEADELLLGPLARFGACHRLENSLALGGLDRVWP
jgi:hypothetical protein